MVVVDRASETNFRSRPNGSVADPDLSRSCQPCRTKRAPAFWHGAFLRYSAAISGAGFHGMLQLAHLVMTLLDRRPDTLDRFARRRGKVIIFQSVLELRLEVIFTAFNFAKSVANASPTTTKAAIARPMYPPRPS
jgi:hypothetical protein